MAGTLILAIAAMLISFVLGIAIGVASAARANTFLDRALMSLALPDADGPGQVEKAASVGQPIHVDW